MNVMAQRRAARVHGDVAVRSVPLRPMRGSVEQTGEVLDAAQVVQRVTWLVHIVGEIGQAVVDAAWTDTGLARYGANKVTSAHDRVKRTFGPTLLPADLVACDRTKRMAREEAGRVLKVAVHQRAIVHALQTDTALPAGTTTAEKRNLSRLVRKNPNTIDFCALVATPPHLSGRIAPLGAVDAQFADVPTVQQDGDCWVWTLRTKLPLVARPRSAHDWAWHVLVVHLPPPGWPRLSPTEPNPASRRCGCPAVGRIARSS